MVAERKEIYSPISLGLAGSLEEPCVEKGFQLCNMELWYIRSFRHSIFLFSLHPFFPGIDDDTSWNSSVIANLQLVSYALKYASLWNLKAVPGSGYIAIPKCALRQNFGCCAGSMSAFDFTNLLEMLLSQIYRPFEFTVYLVQQSYKSLIL